MVYPSFASLNYRIIAQHASENGVATTIQDLYQGAWFTGDNARSPDHGQLLGDVGGIGCGHPPRHSIAGIFVLLHAVSHGRQDLASAQPALSSAGQQRTRHHGRQQSKGGRSQQRQRQCCNKYAAVSHCASYHWPGNYRPKQQCNTISSLANVGHPPLM